MGLPESPQLGGGQHSGQNLRTRRVELLRYGIFPIQASKGNKSTVCFCFKIMVLLEMKLYKTSLQSSTIQQDGHLTENKLQEKKAQQKTDLSTSALHAHEPHLPLYILEMMVMKL